MTNLFHFNWIVNVQRYIGLLPSIKNGINLTKQPKMLIVLIALQQEMYHSENTSIESPYYTYHIYLKYLDTLSTYHTCPKI